MEETMAELVKRFYRSTGVPVLDQLMYGIPRGGLTLVYGSQKAGKTTFAMQCAVQVAHQEEKHVLYLDTESGGVGPLRLYSLAAAQGMDQADAQRAVSLIHIHQANELSDQHRIITEDWRTAVETFDVGLFVVDSIAWHYHQRVMNAPSEHVGSVARELLGKLEQETKTLLSYAKKSNASVIFTTWSASKAKKAFEQHQLRELEKSARKGYVDVRDLDIVLGTYGEDYIGGRFLGYMAKVIARIWRLQGDMRFFVIEAHREKPDGVGLYMRVTEAGLQPVEGAKPARVEVEMRRRLVEEEAAAVAQDSDGGREARQPAGGRMGRRKS
ncbi:MAG: ATPase domain-containing protein [Candidatus Caldarchaeum sp.]